MGIVLGDNIDYKGKKPLDSRMLFDTIADMKAYSENYLPDITLAFNKEDSKMYVFNRENDVDEDTGKWRVFESDSAIAVEDLTNYNEDENRVEEQYMVMKRNITTQKWDKLPENSMQDKNGTYSFNNYDVAGKYRFNNCVVSDGHPAMLNLDGQGKVHGVLEVFESYVYNQTSTSTGGIVFQRFTTTNSGQQLQFTRRKAFGHSGTWGAWTMEQTNRQSVNRGKTYAFFGGSVCYNWNPLSGTAADNYAIEEILGVNSIRKRAISGAGWVAGNKIDNQITTELAEANPADVWVFWSSTNDHTAQVPIGDLDHKTDTTTVIGAMCNAIERVRTAKPTANILMTTPIRRFNNESGWNPYYDDGTTIPFYKYAEAVYTVANYYGIPVFDLWNNSGIDIKNYTTYMSDTIHPNANGYKLFQRELCKFCADGHNGNNVPVPMGEKDKANIIDGTEIKDLFGGTEEDIKIKTITDEIENDKAPLRNKEWAFRANVGYFTPVDQVGIQGKNIYSINLWDGRAGDIDVYAVNVGVTSGTLTLNQFPADLSAYEAASSKICTLHLLGDGQHRRFVLDGTDSNVTDINEDFVNEAGYVEISTGYFLSFKDYSASGTGGVLYGGVEGMGREVGFCYFDDNATRQLLSGNLAVGVSTVTETEGTGTAYAFDTYLRDEENNTLRSKEIEEAKKSVDNLFNVETVSTVKIGPGVDQASFVARSQAYGQTSTSGPFIMYDQRGIQGKKLYSIGIGCNTNTKGGAIDIHIAHLNNTGEVLTKASFPTNVEDFLPLCERLCTVTFPTNDGNNFYTFKLDGTDSRVSNINSNYVGDDGYIEIPVGYYIGLKTWNTSNAPAFTYSGTIDVNNPYSIGWAYYTSDGTTGTIAENATAMLGLQFNIIEGTEQKHYNFDDKLVTTIKHEEHIDFAPSCETGGTKGLSATNYFLGNRIFFPMGSHNIEQCSMNGKYLRGISYVGIANTPVYFVLAHVEDNTINYAGTTNSDCYAISTGTPENNYNGKALFKITPDANVDTSKPTIYKLDGTDSRVTILNTDLYDSEEGGFLFDKTWLVGINCMGFTNTNNTTPDGTYPAKYLRTTGYGFLSYNTTTPSASATFGKDSNNSLMLTFYTDVDEITYEEQINSKVIADLKEKVDNIDMAEVESPLKGKYISLIGDSISTYQGWSNVAPLSTSAAVYYPRGDVSNVNYTYWKMLVDRTGANLLVNNSWSGSTLCSQGTAPVIGTGANDRCHQLDKDGHLPDYIIINIGTNDFDRSFGLGTWNGRGEDFPANASTATATTFREAYAIMLARLQEYYPLAKIYCCTFPCGNRLARGINERNTNGVYLVEFNDAIREIATAFGCRVIDLASSGLNYRTLQTLFCDYNASSQGGEGDALHPNIAGMERFYELIRGAMESESSNTSAATRKTLVDLRDTAITSPVTGQGLVYDAVTGKWINGKASDVLTFKGSVADYASLPSSDQEVGDVWNCLDNNKNYVWTGTAWDEFSSSYTFSNVDVKNSWVKQLYGLQSGSISDFIVGEANGGTTMKVKRGVGECVADFMTINLTGVGRGKYVTIKVKNNNVDYVTDVMNYMEFGGCGNANFDWSGFWWVLGSFDKIKKEAVFVIDTDKEFQDIISGSTTKTWANVIQFNTRRFYQAGQKKLQALSADFELSVYIQTKETKASNIVVADTADSAKDAGHAELAHMVGVKPLTGMNVESGFLAKTGPDTPSGIFSTTLIGGKIRMNIASFTKDESTTQYYYVYSRPVKKYLNKGYKFFVRVRQTNPYVSGSTMAINEWHFSTARDVWGGAQAMGHSMTPGRLNTNNMTSYVAEITPNTYTGSASEVYLQISAFTTAAGTYSANTCDIEVFVTEPDYFLPYNTYSMVSKAEMDAAISAAGDTYQNCITFWGDSLTAGGGWTTRLASLAGMTERNGGTGGENARTIVARQGADVMMINNKTIPASGAVTLYTRSADVGIPTQEGYKVTPLLQGGAHVNPVKIGDITGTLAWTGSSYADQNGTWTFTRSTAGEAVTIDRPTAMTTNFDRTYNNPHLMVIFIGQNGGYSDLDDLVRQHRLMIDHAKAKHYIVLGLSSGSAEQRADYETRMKKEFGRYFISLREYLSTPIYDGSNNIISCYGMADQNVEIDPTYTYDGKTTVQEIAAGICPHQILADSVHYTSGTKTVIGNYLYKKCKELGIF